MKRRVFGAVLAGLGVLFLVIAVGLPLVVAPAVTKLPYTLQACPAANEPQPEGCLKPSIAEATGATFLDRSTGEIEQGTLRSSTEVVPDAKMTADWMETGSANRLQGDAFIWTVYGRTSWVEGNKRISAYSTQFALDRKSAAALPWDGQWLDEEGTGVVAKKNVVYEGQTYKFPFGTEQGDGYKIFDRDVRRAEPVQFIAVTAVEGLEAYHFRQIIDRQEAQNVTPASLNTLRTRFAPTATTGRVMYSNTREVWIDPVTGSYLNVRERQMKVFVPDVGSETTLLDADFKYTPETVRNAVDAAKRNQSRLDLVGLYLPIGFGVLGLVLLVAGLVLLLGRRRRPAVAGDSADPATWQSDLPSPRHRLRDDGAATERRGDVLTDTVPGDRARWPDST